MIDMIPIAGFIIKATSVKVTVPLGKRGDNIVQGKRPFVSGE